MADVRVTVTPAPAPARSDRVVGGRVGPRGASGAPGRSAAQQAYDAGLIDQPTIEALDARYSAPGNAAAADAAALVDQVSDKLVEADQAIAQAAAVVGAAQEVADAAPELLQARDDAVAAQAVTESIVDNAGAAFQLYDSAEAVQPVVVDADDGVALGFLKATGKAIGSLVGSMLAQAAVITRRRGGDDLEVYTESEATAVYPFLVDADGAVLLGYNGATKRPVGHLVDYLSNGSALSTWPALMDWNGLISYGQSLSVGARGQPPLSTSQPYFNLTFTNGPKTAVGTGTAGTKPLVEDSLQEGGVSGGNRGETMCSGMANWANQTAAIENGIDPADFVTMTSAPGEGSQTIGQLIKGTSYYTRLLGHASEAKARATAAGKSYAVHVVTWIQGETFTTTRADYFEKLVQFPVDLNADIPPLTGQETPVHVLSYQTPRGVTANAGAVALAQFDAIEASDLIHFVMPFYFLPYSPVDQLHLINTGYLWAGRYFGRAYKQLTIDRRIPDCLWPLSATAKGTTVSVKFRVPTLPLVFDTTTIAALQDKGFKVVDDTGTLTLSAITIVGDSVQMTVNRALGANPKVRCALDYTHASILIDGGAACNLHDSTPDTGLISGVARAMPHWAPHFELSIASLDAST